MPKKHAKKAVEAKKPAKAGKVQATPAKSARKAPKPALEQPQKALKAGKPGFTLPPAGKDALEELLKHSDKGTINIDAMQPAAAVKAIIEGAVVTVSSTDDQTRDGKPMPEGMVEITIEGSPYKLLGCIGMDKPGFAPSLEQRVAMARRLVEVGPKLSRYVPKAKVVKAPPPPPVEKAADDAPTAAKKPAAKMGAKEKRKADAVAIAASAAKHAAAAQERKKADAKPAPKPGATKPAPPVKKKGKGIQKPSAVPPGGFNKDNKPETSGALIRSRIMEHKLTDEAIAAEVRKLWPGRTTAETDVRWNRGQLLKAGITAPDPVVK